MSDTVKRVLIGVGVAAILTLLFVSGFFAGRMSRRETFSTRVDTLTVRDTITQYKPIVKEIRKLQEVFIPGDTVRIHDTVCVAVRMESRVYEDSCYRAVISGYRPSLDTIQVFRQTSFITSTRVVREPRWRRFTYGVQLGIGAQYGLIGKTFDVGPYLGIGIGWNF